MKAALCAIFIVLSSWGAVASAADRWVDDGKDSFDGGNNCLHEDFPCRTITYAIEQARPGDTIRVKGGTYKMGESFPITVNKPFLKIIADAKATIDGSGSTAEAIIKITAPDVEFKGSKGKEFTLKNGTIGILVEGASAVIIDHYIIESVSVGIELYRATGVTIGGSEGAKNEIKNPSVVAIRLKQSYGNEISYSKITGATNGIFLEESHGNRVSHNTIEVSQNTEDPEDGNGIRAVNADNNIIVNNLICFPKLKSSSDPPQCEPSPDNRGENGILLRAEGEIESQGNELIGNAISGYAAGVVQSGSFKLTAMKENIITDNGAGIKLKGTSYDTVIVGNTASNNDGNGISLVLRGGGDNRVSDNTATANGGHGIYFEGPEATNQGPIITISSNITHQNGKSGIHVVNSLGSVLFLNTVWGNGGAGIVLMEGSYNALIGNDVRFHEEISATGISLEGGRGNRLLDNRVEKNGLGIFLSETNDNLIVGNTVSDNKCNGIELNDSSANELQGNTVIQNAKERKCPDGQLLSGGIVLKGRSESNAIIDGNIIQGNQNGIVVRDNSGANIFECNDISESVSNGILLISVLGDLADNRFHRNNIVGNKKFGLRNFTAMAVDVRFNWWGSPLGPQHPANPPAEEEGQADKIAGPADFTPWLESPLDLESCS